MLLEVHCSTPQYGGVNDNGEEGRRGREGERGVERKRGTGGGRIRKGREREGYMVCLI